MGKISEIKDTTNRDTNKVLLVNNDNNIDYKQISFQEQFLDFLNNEQYYEQQLESKLRETRSSDSLTSINEETNNYVDDNDLLSEVVSVNLQFQNQLHKEINDFINWPLRINEKEASQFYCELGKELINWYQRLFSRFDLIIQETRWKYIVNNKELELKKIKIIVNNLLQKAKDDIHEKISNSLNFQTLRNLLVKYINYISHPFDIFLLDVTINAVKVKKIINKELIKNWNEKFLLIQKKINEKINFFLNDFDNNINKMEDFKLVINNIVDNWENSSDKIFDIFFLILRKKISFLLENLQKKNEIFTLENREIIKDDFTNLFEIYKQENEELNTTIESLFMEIIKENQEVIESYIPELRNETTKFLSSTNSILYNNDFIFNYQQATQLYKKYKDIGQNIILEYEKFIQILKNMNCKLQPQITKQIIAFVNFLLLKLQENIKQINDKTSNADFSAFHCDLVKYRSNIDYYIYKKIFFLHTEKDDNFLLFPTLPPAEVQEWLIGANLLSTANDSLLKKLLDLLTSTIAENEVLLDKKTPEDLKNIFLQLKEEFLKQIHVLKNQIHEYSSKQKQKFSFLNNILFLKLTEKANELENNVSIIFNSLKQKNTTNEIISSMKVFNKNFVLQFSLYNELNSQIIRIINTFFVNFLIKDAHRSQELVLNFTQDIAFKQKENLLLLYENWEYFSEVFLKHKLISQDRTNITKKYIDLLRKVVTDISNYIKKLSTTLFSIVDKDSVLISEDSQKNETMSQQVIKLLEIYKKRYEELITNNNSNLTNEELNAIHHTFFIDNLQLSIKMNLFFYSQLIKLEYDNLKNNEMSINWFNDFIKNTYEIEEKNAILINQIKSDVLEQITKLELNKEKELDISSFHKTLIIKVENFILEFKRQNKLCFNNLFSLQKIENPYLLFFLETELKNFVENLMIIFAPLKKINTYSSIIKEELLILNKNFNFYLEQYQFLFTNLININNIYLEEKVVANQKALIKIRSLPSLETEINNFNDNYFNLLKQNLLISKALFKRDFLISKSDIKNFVNKHKEILIQINNKLEDIILLLELETKLLTENNIKKYTFINIISYIKEVINDQKISIENLNVNLKYDEVINENNIFFQSIFNINNFLQCIKFMLSPNISMVFINNFHDDKHVSSLLWEIENFKSFSKNEKVKIQEKINEVVADLVIKKNLTNGNSINLINAKISEFIKNFKKRNDLFFVKIFGKNNNDAFLSIFFQNQFIILEQMFDQILEELKQYAITNRDFYSEIETLWNSFSNYIDWYLLFTFDPITKILEVIQNMFLGKKQTLNIKENFILNPNQIVNTQIIFSKTYPNNVTEIEFKSEPSKEGNSDTTIILNILLFMSGPVVLWYIDPGRKERLLINHGQQLNTVGEFSSISGIVSGGASNNIVNSGLGAAFSSAAGFKVATFSFVNSKFVSFLTAVWNWLRNLFSWSTFDTENEKKPSIHLKSIYAVIEKKFENVKTALTQPNSTLPYLTNIEEIVELSNKNETDVFNLIDKFEEENTNSVPLEETKDSATNIYNFSENDFEPSENPNPPDSEIKNGSNNEIKFNNKELNLTKIKFPKSNVTKNTILNENKNTLKELQITSYTYIKINTLEDLFFNFDKDFKKFKYLFDFLRTNKLNLALLKEDNNSVYSLLINFLENNQLFFKNQEVIKNSFFLNDIENFLHELICDLQEANSKQAKTFISEDIIKNISEKLYLYYDWFKTINLKLQNRYLLSFEKINENIKIQYLPKKIYAGAILEFKRRNKQIIEDFFGEENIKHLRRKLIDTELKEIQKKFLQELFSSLKKYSEDVAKIAQVESLDISVLINSFFNLEYYIIEKKVTFLSLATPENNDLETLFNELINNIKKDVLFYVQMINIKTTPEFVDLDKINILGKEYEPISWPTKIFILNIEEVAQNEFSNAMEVYQAKKNSSVILERPNNILNPKVKSQKLEIILIIAAGLFFCSISVIYFSLRNKSRKKTNFKPLVPNDNETNTEECLSGKCEKALLQNSHVEENKERKLKMCVIS